MLTLSEKQIEELIYSCPWLLDERFLIPDIVGAEGEKGRQINLGKRNSRFIDLLFKDTRDNRPVIVELKRGKLQRESIAQILEYRALLLSLDEEKKEYWEKEFEQNFHIPKLILVGSSADEETILSANLAGVELRLFGTNSPIDLGFDSFKDLKVKADEWESFRKSGNRTLLERAEWVEIILERIISVVENYEEEVTTIHKVPQLSGSKYYIKYTFPFITIPIFYLEENIISFYEYHDEFTPFNENHIYVEFPYLFNYEEFNFEYDDLTLQKAFESTKSIKINGIEYLENMVTGDSIPTFKLRRSTLEDAEEFSSVLKMLIGKSIQIYKQHFE